MMHFSHVGGSLNQDDELGCSNTYIQNTVYISKVSMPEEYNIEVAVTKPLAGFKNCSVISVE